MNETEKSDTLIPGRKTRLRGRALRRPINAPNRGNFTLVKRRMLNQTEFKIDEEERGDWVGLPTHAKKI